MGHPYLEVLVEDLVPLALSHMNAHPCPYLILPNSPNPPFIISPSDTLTPLYPSLEPQTLTPSCSPSLCDFFFKKIYVVQIYIL